jgi:hypothetical protein
MTTITRRARPAKDQVPEDDVVLDHAGYTQPRPGFSPTIEIATQIDGVESQVARDGSIRYGGGLLTQLPALDLDVLTVANIALSRLLYQMEIFSVDLQARIENPADLQARAFKFTDIIYEYPRAEDEKKTPVATIEQGSEVLYGSKGETPHLLEESENVYLPGTVLRSIASASVELIVTVTLGHKDERRGVRAAFERHLLTEPDSEKFGRRIVVREYFDRSVRFQLLGSPAPPVLENQQNRWFYLARILAEVERVVLVRSPVEIDVPRRGVAV